MRSRARESCWYGLGLALAACSGSNEYSCVDDGQCVDKGVAGVCADPGFCAFPDDACPSNHRFGEHAGDGLAGVCTDPIPSTEGSAGSTSAVSFDDGGPTSAPGSVGEEASSDPTTSIGLDDGSTSMSMSTSGDATTSAIESSSTDPTGVAMTTGEPDPCPTYVDDFEDGVIGNEWVVFYEDYVSEAGGARVFTVTPPDDFYPATHLLGLDLTQGWVRAEVGAYPSSYSEQLFLEVSPTNSEYDNMFWFIEGDTLIARYDFEGMGWTSIGDVPFDPNAHHWLQIRVQDDTFYFEVADDSMRFETLFMHPAPFDVSNVGIAIFAGNYDLLDADVDLSFTHFELCIPP